MCGEDETEKTEKNRTVLRGSAEVQTAQKCRTEVKGKEVAEVKSGSEGDRGRGSEE